MKNFFIQVVGIGVTSSVLFLALTLGVRKLLGEAVAAADVYLVAGFLILLLVLIVFFGFRLRILRMASRPVEYGTGINKVFRSFDRCETELMADLAAAKSVRILVQIGTSVLVGNRPLYEHLEELANGKVQMQFLHASDSSPYLSKEVAAVRNSNYQRWLKDITQARLQLRFLELEPECKLVSREHKEPFLARIFILDQVAYVQPYLYPKDNSQQALVFRLSRNFSWRAGEKVNPRSLFSIVAKYFDHVWTTAVAARSSAALIPAGAQVCVVGIFRYSNRFVFVVPMRHLVESSDGSIPFHFPGGKVLAREGWKDAVIREVQEEIGIRLEVVSSKETCVGAQSDAFQRIDVPDDLIKPSWIYDRGGGTVPWIVGFDGRVSGRSPRPAPLAETAAVILLTPKMLKRCAGGGITLKDVLSSTDGSQAIVRKGFDLDPDRRLSPLGLTERLVGVLAGGRQPAVAALAGGTDGSQKPAVSSPGGSGSRWR